MKINKFSVSLIVFLISTATCVPSSFLYSQNSINDDASGENVLRIENEYKFLTPDEIVSDLWQFLCAEFGESGIMLSKFGANFSAKESDEIFRDRYFDTPNLDLLKINCSIRHRRRINTLAFTDPKSGRELMQIKVSNISQNLFNRGEYKYDIDYTGELIDAEDRHPMLGIVKKVQRREFKQRLNALHADAMAMRPVLTLEQRRRRIYINRGLNPFISISLDEVKAPGLWFEMKFYELELELNEVVYTEADLHDRRFMESINRMISDEILKKFPSIKKDLTPKYNKVFTRLKAQNPLLPYYIKNKTKMELLLLIALIITSGGIFLIIYGRKKMRIASQQKLFFGEAKGN
jgi:hypothetical protein